MPELQPILEPASADAPALPPLPVLASEVVWLEPEASLLDGFAVRLGQSVAEHLTSDRISNFWPQTVSGPIRNYRLQDVLLDASMMGLYRGRYPIRDTLYLVTDNQYEYGLIKPLHLTATDPAYHHLVAATIAFTNYYHWMIQSLPAIDWGVRRRADRPVMLALPVLERWQEQSLALLGLDAMPRLTLDLSTTYHLASAEYSEFLSGRAPFMVSRAAAATFARLRRAVPPAPDGAPEIYVARVDSTNRVMENEAELIDMLQSQGVRIVLLGGLPVARQLALFRRARIVIGPHGAGLSNIIGCEPGTHLYELLPSHYPNHCFNRIAQTCGLHYWADVFPSVAGDASEHQRRWRVDVDAVAAQLDAIRTAVGSGVPAGIEGYHPGAINLARPSHAAGYRPAP